MYYSQQARLAIYAQGEFGKGHSKTAEGVLRYAPNPVVAVIDGSECGKTVEQVTGIPSPAPIVGSVIDCLDYRPDALLIGTAWTGGHLPPEWRPEIITAIKSGLDIINGLHDFLSEDEEIAQVAASYRRKLLDVRRPPEHLAVASGQAAQVTAFTCLTVGSDCSVGKMTTSLELTRLALARGYSARFVATGQTGIMIAGEGIAIDRVIGDFMAGAAEKLVVEAGFAHDFVFVEGQGSLVHPGFSGVTLALLHGACPKTMILCHKVSKTCVGESSLPIPALPKLISVYQGSANLVRPASVVGISLNTAGLNDQQARQAVEAAEAETGLPATDPLRFGADNLFEAVLAFREKPA